MDNLTSGGHAPSPSLPLTRLLLRLDPVSQDGVLPETIGLSLERGFSRVIANLCDSLGPDGCNALFSRALVRVGPRHPVLTSLCSIGEHGVRLDGTAAAIEAQGSYTVLAATEVLLAEVHAVLGRLIGDDMAIRLMDPEIPSSDADREGSQ